MKNEDGVTREDPICKRSPLLDRCTDQLHYLRACHESAVHGSHPNCVDNDAFADWKLVSRPHPIYNAGVDQPKRQLSLGSKKIHRHISTDYFYTYSIVSFHIRLSNSPRLVQSVSSHSRHQSSVPLPSFVWTDDQPHELLYLLLYLWHQK